MPDAFMQTHPKLAVLLQADRFLVRCEMLVKAQISALTCIYVGMTTHSWGLLPYF